MKLYTADTHFNHEAIRKQYRQQWASVDEMNQTIINNWNSVVEPGDLVYHLGDFALKSKYNAWDIDYIISQLEGQIILIRGNHDDRNMKKYEEWFVKVEYLAYIKEQSDEGPDKIMMCHYPMRSWRASIHGSFHLFGHSHGNMKPWGRSIDIGMDGTFGFYPRPWSYIKPIILANEEEGAEYVS